MKSKWNWIILAIIVIPIAAGAIWLLRPAVETLLYGSKLVVEGETDKTASWANIRDSVDRDSDWKQIVEDSPFRLGESEAADLIPRDGTEERYLPYPALDGSTVAVPMALEFVWQHLPDLDDYDAEHFVSFNTTHEAYLRLISGEPASGGYIASRGTHMYSERPLDLIIATYPSADELAEAEAAGVELIARQVCYDAFVFITHSTNPVDSLTLEQVRAIYAGEITNWSQVGGDNSAIMPYQREAGSGSQTAMEELVMAGTAMMNPIIVDNGMGPMIDHVAEYQNDQTSLGYTYLYYIDRLYSSPDIKVLAIDGVSPDAESIRGGSYPLAVGYYGVIRAEDADDVGGLFLDWMISEEGQECIEQAGYIAVK